VDGGGTDTLALELLDEAVGAALGADEDEDLRRPRQMDAATLTLSIWWTWRKRCSMESTVVGPRPLRDGRDR